MTILSALEWDQFLSGYADAHLLQTSVWGELKSRFGWQAARVQSGSCGAQVLFRPLPLGFSIAYIPKGPVGGNWAELWPEIDKLCRWKRALILKVEPDLDDQLDEEHLRNLAGFHFTERTIQPRRTLLINLAGSEQDWLSQMKQKTRYNIRLAEKKDVVVHQSNNLDAFYRLMMVTGQRDRFKIHSRDYFETAYQLFSPSNSCAVFEAQFQGRSLASLMVFARGKRAWYFYGASSDEERNRMPAYLLQWQAMRWAKSRGCTEYDLWGVPDADEETLEAGFERRSDGLWGVYRFKRGFGGKLTRSAGAWEKAYLPFIYPLYLRLMKRRGEAE